VVAADTSDACAGYAGSLRRLLHVGGRRDASSMRSDSASSSGVLPPQRISADLIRQ